MSVLAALPSPPSWYPGHMRQFMRMLPALLTRTDVVLELRDARLPLTSINSSFETILQKWQKERYAVAAGFANSATNPGKANEASLKGHSSTICERIVVMNKRDLVSEWGIEPFRKAMAAKFPDQRVIFASWNRPRDVKTLLETIVNVARENRHISNELNVLVVGMPNVGKSTLLNALRNIGIPGPTPKALRTSAHPGLTRALSTRLKLSQDPLVYSFDSPGVMLPFLGKGELGAERGIKLALIAGIREGLYSEESLASYLLYRLNLLNPSMHLPLFSTDPAYLAILPPDTPPTHDLAEFLAQLARRLGMLKRGGEPDVERAAVWFVKWWREQGCLLSSSAPMPLVQEEPQLERNMSCGDACESPERAEPSGLRGGWGFDFEWDVGQGPHLLDPSPCDAVESMGRIQQRMAHIIDAYVERLEEEQNSDEGVSETQRKKKEKEEQRARRAKRVKALLEARRSGR